MDAAGAAPDAIRLPADLRGIPTTSKSDYRRCFPEGSLARGRSLNDRQVFISQSSGTAGDRLQSASYSFDLADRMRNTLAIRPDVLRMLHSMQEHRCIRYAAPNCSAVECASPTATIKDRTLADGTLVLPVAHDLLTTSKELVDQAVDEAIGWRPQWIYADPTHLAFLVREFAKRSMPAPVDCKFIVLTYSRATRPARRQIEDFFGPAVPVVELLSMSEVGWLALQCERGALHFNSRNFFCEILVGDRPAEIGEIGELVVTSLKDRLSPYVRYRTADAVRLLPKCECGNPTFAIRHEGRNRDLIRRGHVVLTASEVDEIANHPTIDLYKFEQLDDRRYSFRFLSAAPSHHDELIDHLKADFMTRLGNDVDIGVTRVDYIGCERSGKFLSCTSRLPAEKISGKSAP
jgi:phenylacetate-CoA ligase